MKAGVIGYPVSHSLSPLIFNYLSSQFNIPLNYKAYEVPSTELKAFCELNKAHVGFNITIPHKETILNYLDDITELEKVGACNVIKMYEKKWIGHNTDIFGIQKTLEEFYINIQEKDVVIIGAGGAARAAIVACEKARSVRVVGRNVSRLKKLQSQFNIQSEHVENEMDYATNSKNTLYINATPVSYESNSEGPLIFDMNYKKRGSLGLHMLIWQALKTWEILFEHTNPYQYKIQIYKLLDNQLHTESNL